MRPLRCSLNYVMYSSSLCPLLLLLLCGKPLDYVLLLLLLMQLLLLRRARPEVSGGVLVSCTVETPLPRPFFLKKTKCTAEPNQVCENLCTLGVFPS